MQIARTALALVVSTFLWASTSFAQPAYSLAGWRSLGLLEGSRLYPTDLNDRGQVVLYSETDITHAFAWTAEGGMVRLAGPADGISSAYAINAAGDIAGSAYGHAVVWRAAGGLTDLGALPGETYSQATAINDRGEVVGRSGTRNFIWSADRGMREIPVASAWVYAIDGHGHVLGATLSTCFIWSESDGYQDIGSLGRSCTPRAITDLHHVVGGSDLGHGRFAAFLWTPAGGMQAVPGTSGFGAAIAHDVSQTGLVVGAVSGSVGGVQGFVWSAERGFQTVGDRALLRVNNLGQVIASRPPNLDEPMLGQVRRRRAPADLNGDASADLLWRHADGRLAAWLMNGTDIAEGVVFSLTVDDGWVVAGTGDFNADGFLDIVWQHDDATLAIWFMRGTDLLDGCVLSPSRPDDADWRVVGVGDVDGDAHPDLLWQHRRTRVLASWLMRGPVMRDGLLLAPSQVAEEWRAVAVGDVNGDMSPDLILRNDRTAALAVWLMFGPTLGDGALLDLRADTSWTVRGAADLNGDGRADLLWQHLDGTPAVWLMNGSSVQDGLLLPRPSAGWMLAGPR